MTITPGTPDDWTDTEEPKRAEAFVERLPDGVGYNLRHYARIAHASHRMGEECHCRPSRIPHVTLAAPESARGGCVEVGDFCDAEFIAHARDDIPHLLALVESLTAERDAAIAWRVEANRVHAERVESLREEFGKREDSQDRIRERLTAEVERLERWKFEACEVMSGLRELGKALGLRPGVQITGPAALAEVARLAAERDALRAVVARVEALADAADDTDGEHSHRPYDGVIWAAWIGLTLSGVAADLRAALATTGEGQ